MGLLYRLRSALGLTESEARPTDDDGSVTADDRGRTSPDSGPTDDTSPTPKDAGSGHEDGDLAGDDASQTPDDDASRTSDHGSRTVDDHSQTADHESRTPVDDPTIGTDESDGSVTPDTAGGSTPPATFAHEAADLAEFWSEYPLDFSPESLRHLDTLVDEHWPDVDDEDDDPDIQRGMVIQFGSYFGETLVHSEDAEWTELDPGAWAVTVRGEAGEATIDVFRVAHDCLQNRGRFFDTYRSVTTEI